MTSVGSNPDEQINPKFGVPLINDDPTGGSRLFAHPNVYELQTPSGFERLALAPAADHIELLRDLAEPLKGPFGILYVLTLSRLGEAKPGRYQIPQPTDAPMLNSFLVEYQEFFEGDARHAIWIMSIAENATLVYDRHNVIYAYGPLARFKAAAEKRGLRAGRIEIPVPHVHSYNAAFDELERRILQHFDWKWFPLQPHDGD